MFIVGKRFNIEDIRKEFESRGYTLLDDEYKGISHKLKYICNTHKDLGEQEIDYNHFHNRNQGCKYCHRDKPSAKRLCDAELIDLCASKNLIFIKSETDKKKTIVNFLCSKHKDKGVQKSSIGNIRKMSVGCKYCIGRNKTTEEFKQQISSLNDDILIIGNYVSATTKIECECKVCGNKWNAVPNNLLCGAGCPKCGIIKSNTNSTKSQDTFIEDLKEVNPLIKVLDKYTGVFNKITVECLVCNTKWEVTPNSLLHSKSGCPTCLKKKMHDTQVKTNEEFIKQLSDVNPNLIPLEEYHNDHTKIKVKCRIHNYVWSVAPNKILHKQIGCPKCTIYTGEQKLCDILTNLGFKYVLQKKFNDCRDKNVLSFDAYLSDLNILIEYDGEGHYKPIKRGSMTEKDAIRNLNYVQKHDNIKTQYCKDNNIPLIRIPYWEIDNMECFLLENINKEVN